MKSLLLFGLLVAAGCTAGPPTFEGDAIFKPGELDVLRSALSSQGDGPNGAHIIFLNFDGQHIQPANYDDPDTGSSWIAQVSVNYAAFDATPYKSQFTADQAKSGIVNYFKQFYAPFNVQVVTARPQGLRYTMCMIGDTSSSIMGGGGGSAAGVAPLDCSNRNESEITYAFAEVVAPNGQFGPSPTEALKAVAVTAAQETAHSYGLSHTNSTQDIMYPQLDPNQDQFVDQNLGLLNNPGGACNGASSQNSKQLLLSNIGASNGGPVGNLPTVKFVAPGSNSTVPMNFTIIVNASETGGTITKVDISAGTQTLFTYTTPPFRSDVTAPQEGQYQITATAYDAAGNFQSASVTFTASKTAPPQQLPPCQSSSECPSGQMCTNGACVGGSTTGTNGGTTGTNGGTTGTNGGGTTGTGGTTGGGIIMGIPTGGDCSNPDGSECAGAACYQGDGDHHYCTNVCDPAVAASCPPGMACTADSGVHLCTFPKSSNGCSAAPGQPGDAAFGFLLMMGLVAALRIRRARG